MAYKLKVVKLEAVDVGDRFRKAYGDIDGLAESIKDKGLLTPITVAQAKDGKHLLLAGGRRYAACQKAGLKDIPALIRDTEDEVDAREVELVENVWREDMKWPERAALLKRLHDLCKAKNQDWSLRKTALLLNKGLGSVSRDLQMAAALEVMPELGKQDTQDQAFKLLKMMEEDAITTELRSRQEARMTEANKDGPKGLEYGLVKMLEIADANYMVGDAFKGLEDMRAGSVVHLIECDPPYGIDLPDQKRGKEEATSTVKSYNEIPANQYNEFIWELTKELYRVAYTHCWLVFWYGPTWHHEVRTALRSAGWQVDDIPCIWYKRSGQTMQPGFNFGRTYEPFFLARKGVPAIIKQGRANVFDFAPVAAQKKYHPTERPRSLMEEIIKSLIPPGSVCLVPFLGSGATLRACYMAGVSGFGWDLNGEYKDKFMLAVEADTRELNGEEKKEDGDEIVYTDETGGEDDDELHM